jgi:NACalpha-BTF3-like transcription factor
MDQKFINLPNMMKVMPELGVHSVTGINRVKIKINSISTILNTPQ